jgi:hypothetical protein
MSADSAPTDRPRDRGYLIKFSFSRLRQNRPGRATLGKSVEVKVEGEPDTAGTVKLVVSLPRSYSSVLSCAAGGVACQDAFGRRPSLHQDRREPVFSDGTLKKAMKRRASYRPFEERLSWDFLSADIESILVSTGVTATSRRSSCPSRSRSRQGQLVSIHLNSQRTDGYSQVRQQTERRLWTKRGWPGS